MQSPPPHLCSPSPRSSKPPSRPPCAFEIGPILVVLLKMSTPREQDHRESEWVTGDQNGLPVIRIVRHAASLVFNSQCYGRTETGILPCNIPLIQLWVATLPLLKSFSSLLPFIIFSSSTFSDVLSIFRVVIYIVFVTDPQASVTCNCLPLRCRDRASLLSSFLPLFSQP